MTLRDSGRSRAGTPPASSTASSGEPAVSVLFVANFPSNTGYAWQHIERLFGQLADRLLQQDVVAFVAYPAIPEPPSSLDGSAAQAVELDASLSSRISLIRTLRFIKRNGTRVVYLTDRPLWRFAYVALRLFGVRRIIVHDRTSGAQTAARGLKRLVKWVLVRLPALCADEVVAVSEFVRRRDLAVWFIPRNRITTIYNGFPVPRPAPSEKDGIRRALKIPPHRQIVACACRASVEKGVQHLLRAFDKAHGRTDPERRPVLVYLGDGPYLRELTRIRSELDSSADIHLPGYLPDAMNLLEDVDLIVVPSIWQDALPSAVLEPMARGMAVIASDVGGVPEMIERDKSGVLVPPGDEARLALAIEDLLADPERRKRLGESAQRRVAECFSLDRQREAILDLIRPGLD